MLVVLQASVDGAPVGRVSLRSGQSVRVGRSGWVEFSLPDAPKLGDAHFEVGCSADGCLIRALMADAPTLVNGEPIEAQHVFDGDEVEAGGARFRFRIEGGPPRPADPPENETAETVAAAAMAVIGPTELWAHLEFDDELLPLAESAKTPDKLIEKLAGEERFLEALRVRAYLLEKPAAVAWGVACLRESLAEPLPAKQLAAVGAAEAWASDPSEPNRRAAEAAAVAAGHEGPGAMLALGAFWSDGSIGPPSGFANPPDERMPSQAVAAALLAAAYSGAPEAVAEQVNAYLARGAEAANAS